MILWRILRLLRLNVQLLFVNDGPKRPWKRNKRGGGLLDRTLLELTRKLFRQLKVPYHEAPGEAEAECARLQALGVVDAVWSDVRFFEIIPTVPVLTDTSYRMEMH